MLSTMLKEFLFYRLVLKYQDLIVDYLYSEIETNMLNGIILSYAYNNFSKMLTSTNTSDIF